jgi:2-oxoglutarate ferredoxin oxidoreductase subunit alpha
VQRASEGKCKVEFLGKYDTQIFTPAEIETAIIKMCEGGNN